MAISYFFEDIPSLKFKKNQLKSWLRTIAEKECKSIQNLNYIFCSDEYILKINKQYLNHNYFTDIITFDYSIKSQISGDIFISIDTVKTNSKKFNTRFIEEFYRVTFHGLLHTIGYNDKSKSDKEIMQAKENEYLNYFKIQ
ncbi:MAG TPA: rRNA maturation RNase YbeY [Bacteroidales bacterium]|nr:MAG: rRNA maturation RNase YbeY [Bacteroidetes bacterium GWF2_33_38]OFY90112.1 MAG: rRNA maturation RNase YbeY [Bacteroidetes bacterium RIFOXYA2_FULL_33_7]HBF88017.1 rRNA maturation RNase YbeY [Bacteroidales bacterium]